MANFDDSRGVPGLLGRHALRVVDDTRHATRVTRRQRGAVRRFGAGTGRSRELVGVEARPADQRAVDVGLRPSARRCSPPSPSRRTGCGPSRPRRLPATVGDRGRGSRRTPPGRRRASRCGRCRWPRSARRRSTSAADLLGRRRPARPACDLAERPSPRCRPPRARRASRRTHMIGVMPCLQDRPAPCALTISSVSPNSSRRSRVADDHVAHVELGEHRRRRPRR